jgi:DHA1 family arabinose polymer transporter-like MFS transporter
MKKTIFSLALGTFGLGMAEFGIMGVLPEIAHDVGVSIPVAGNMIAWYAFGVVIGAPVMALFSSRFSLKSVMLFLAALCILGNTLFTFSSSYFMLAQGGWCPASRMAPFWRRGDYSVENGAAG